MEFNLVYMSIIENMKGAAAVLDTGLKIIYVNPAFEELTGLYGEDIGNQDSKKVLKQCGLDIKKIIPVINLCDMEWSLFQHTGRLINSSGEKREIKVSVTPINEQEKITGAVVVIEDITDLREIEKKQERTREALKLSEAKYRELVKTANSIILRMDTAGNVIFINEYALRFFGFSRKDVTGKSVFDTIVPDSDSAGSDQVKEIKRVLKNPDKYSSFENENIKSTGERAWVAWTNKGIYDKKGKLTEILSIGNDITKVIAAEEQLKLLMKGIDQANDAVLILDSENRIKYANSIFREKIALRTTNIAGKKPWKIVKLKKYKDLLKQITENLEVNKKWSGEIEYNAADGTAGTGEMTVTPVRNSIGEITHYINIIRDVSAKKKLEEKISRLRREYESFMRHELRNYLTPIKSFTDLMLEITNKGLSDKQLHYLTRIKDNVYKTVHFIDKLKTLQDFEWGSYTLTKIECDLSEILEKVVEDMELLAKKYDVRIVFNNSLTSSNMNMDFALMPGVFVNLIKNAVEHVCEQKYEKERTVKIDAHNKGGLIVVKINNRGEPVPPEKLKLFFEKFNSDKKNKADGTGIGTTYAFLVTRAHGGRINVTSDAAEGTTVTIEFKSVQD